MVQKVARKGELEMLSYYFISHSIKKHYAVCRSTWIYRHAGSRRLRQPCDALVHVMMPRTILLAATLECGTLPVCSAQLVARCQ